MLSLKSNLNVLAYINQHLSFAIRLLKIKHMTLNTKRKLVLPSQNSVDYYSLPALQEQGFPNLPRLPRCLAVILESLLRHEDGLCVTSEHIQSLASWSAQAPRTQEIPFIVARIVLQDFTGVPLLVDLASMRETARNLGQDPARIEPQVPVDLVVDHSVQVDFFNTDDALEKNMQREFERNHERYQFMKWGMQAFKTFRVTPPGHGIVHQINLERLAQSVWINGGVCYPDSLVGTDSHTTMINGLGTVGWGVGGIEAEAGMLGQPIYFLMPDVVGVELTGSLQEGITATDLVLTITETLRNAKVVGKFVEFFGPGAAALSIPDRATLANMAPEYGATMGYFPVDSKNIEYLKLTGRSETNIELAEHYWKAQKLFGMPLSGDIDYSQTILVDLSKIEPSVAGPKRPQDRISLPHLKKQMQELLLKPITVGGFGLTAELNSSSFPLTKHQGILHHGSIVLAAITSCTNTSNPSVMLTAGLVAQAAIQRGLKIAPWIKTSLAPGSRVVSSYLKETGLQEYLDQLGFKLVGYGCTTCIGNSGPLEPEIEKLLATEPLVACSVLSGNRNFEARIHPNIRANFLMSPPLVVAFALAGRIDIDLTKEPLGQDTHTGQPVFLKDLWPSSAKLQELLTHSITSQTYQNVYSAEHKNHHLWDEINAQTGTTYPWTPSTYIANPPFFEHFKLTPDTPKPIQGTRALAIFGDSITTDHISPAGSIKTNSPAGQYLVQNGVNPPDFNSYGARRGHHEIMMRGTFANVRLHNKMTPKNEGGITRHQPSGDLMSIYDAAIRYQAEKVDSIIFAGEEYGTGSSRDWAAKGTFLLGVRAVIAQSFERIHRSNLVGMGVLPCQFTDSNTLTQLSLDGTETFDLEGTDGLYPKKILTLIITKKNNTTTKIPVILRIDTPIEISYYQHGGILPYVLRQLIS
jgi:aconitate hydratase